MASIFLGTCAALRDGPLSIPWLGLTVLGIFALEVAKNASGEVFDFDSGTDLGVSDEDRSPFSGGKRVLVDDLLSRRQTWAVAVAGYATGGAAGITILLLREPRVLGLGLTGIALAFFYHAPPFKLSYRGFGELAVGICYGPLICGGTYLVQRGTVHLDIVLLSVPLGILVASFLWINEFPDYRADRAAGKRNLVVRLGRARASWWLAALFATALVILALLPVLGTPPGVLMGGIAAIPAFRAARIAITRPNQTDALIPAQAASLVAFLVLALGSGVGILI